MYLESKDPKKTKEEFMNSARKIFKENKGDWIM